MYLTLAESRYQAGVLAAGIQVELEPKGVGCALEQLVVGGGGIASEACRYGPRWGLPQAG